MERSDLPSCWLEFTAVVNVAGHVAVSKSPSKIRKKVTIWIATNSS